MIGLHVFIAMVNHGYIGYRSICFDTRRGLLMYMCPHVGLYQFSICVYVCWGGGGGAGADQVGA